MAINRENPACTTNLHLVAASIQLHREDLYETQTHQQNSTASTKTSAINGALAPKKTLKPKKISISALLNQMRLTHNDPATVRQ